jgi:two-component system response regulator PilR (NtrC family)
MKSTESVLVVDDQELIREILVKIVEREGYSVDEAGDGQEALEKLAEKSYQFVISDIKMPRMDGIELLKAIKAQYPETMVLLITAYSGRIGPRMALEVGADCFITKPFKNMEISQTLRSLSARREKKLRLRRQAANR